MPRALPQDTQDSIKSALMSNRSPKDIAGEFGIHPKTVRRYRNKLFAPMVPATHGRHVLVSSAMKEYIKVLLIKGALKTAKNAHRMLMRLGYSMSYRSAINVLVSMGFHARPEVSMGKEVSKLVHTTVASSSVLR
ncbi:hypothetical protein G6F29_014220 [Rhizopus arrhizus]|nr:hypothetical protein G6F29_014220 [Rhizopus arrhizus]KAG0992351.1 hypothetical protein G6F27_014185 [Rhizopus arrhizus]KAG1015507.1 hypothetical protein G6F25_014278 [Rhizopus arrhizus]KAG1080259.1 hypothetical protein G6F39_014146 [Rhizopus arrhizus]KAG1387655.1 hypothetical protein G6F60_014034 [Rhizopus arrhizus]